MNHIDEAKRLVLGDRNDQYGNPKDDYIRTAKIWSGILSAKLKADITPEEAILMMVGMKLSRLCHKHKDDTLTDAHGYLLCYQWAQSGVKPGSIVVDNKSKACPVCQGAGLNEVGDGQCVYCEATGIAKTK